MKGVQMRQMVQAEVGGVILAAHTDKPVPDSEWAEFITLLQAARRRSRRVRILVRTSGSGGPNSKQRRLLADLGKEVRAAVVTESTVVRGIVTAIGWLQSMDIRAFSPEEVSIAMRFLEVPDRDVAPTVVELERLRIGLH